MQIKLFLNSAFELKNVNWRYGSLQPYAIAWIDSSAKCSTKVDVNNGDNPVWNEKFTIPLPPTSHPQTAILYVEIVHAKPAADTKPLVGSVNLPIILALNEVRSKGKANFSLVLERPSGRPQGSLEIQIEMKDTNIIQNAPYGQPARNMPRQSQPQPQIQPQPQPVNQYQPQPMQQFQPQPQLQQMPQPQYQSVQQINQYRNMPTSTRPGYPANAPPNLRPGLAQQPGNAMLFQPGRPQYRPVTPQSSSLGLGNALCSLAFGVNPMQIKRMMGSVQRIQAAACNRVQGANTGMVNNNGFLGSSGNANGNDPSAAQGYDNSAGYADGSYTMDGSGSSGNANGNDPVLQGYDNSAEYADGSYTMDGYGNVGYDDGTGVDGQFGTDGAFGDGGFDIGGFDMGGLDMGGFDLGSGLDLGGLDMSGLSM